MQVEVGQGLALYDDLGCARKCVHEVLQGLLHFKNDLCPARGDLRHIAAELERVAETLLGMKKDGLPGDLMRSTPLVLREAPLECIEMRGFPSPFIFLPTAPQVARHQPAERRVMMSVGEVRAQRDRAVVMRHC